MKKIELGTIVFYVHRPDDRPGSCYVSPGIVTKPSRDGDLMDMTIFTEAGSFLRKHVEHAITLQDLSDGNKWISKEECEMLKIDLSDCFFNPTDELVERLRQRTQMLDEGKATGCLVYPLSVEETFHKNLDSELNKNTSPFKNKKTSYFFPSGRYKEILNGFECMASFPEIQINIFPYYKPLKEGGHPEPDSTGIVASTRYRGILWFEYCSIDGDFVGGVLSLIELRAKELKSMLKERIAHLEGYPLPFNWVDPKNIKINSAHGYTEGSDIDGPPYKDQLDPGD